MALIKMIALQPLVYNGRRLAAGQQFSAYPRHARILAGTRPPRAELAPPPPDIGKGRGRYSRRDLVAEEPVELPKLSEAKAAEDAGEKGP